MQDSLLSPRDITRFWSKVDTSGECWLWTASTIEGYGAFKFHGVTLGAHRVAFYIYHGIWPTHDVLHTCDIRRCVRSDHLYEGTDKDNVHDAYTRGRRHVVRGEDCSWSKFDKESTRGVRELISLGVPQKEIADQLGVSYSMISRIATGKYEA